MNRSSPIFLLMPIIIILIAVVIFWFISKKAPKGVALAVAVVAWIAGRAIGSQQARELMMLGGSIQMAGSIGVILGIIDLFRKRKTDIKK